VLEDGMLQVPAGLGIGVEPLPEVLARQDVVIETLFQR
jgi:L-alanine-DL-glutamate epimerase-like enolase superfamily enzyme